MSGLDFEVGLAVDELDRKPVGAWERMAKRPCELRAMGICVIHEDNELCAGRWNPFRNH